MPAGAMRAEVASTADPGMLFEELRRELAELDPDALLDRLTPAAELASLGLDSMTLMSAIADIESKYSIRLPHEQLMGLETVGQLIAVIQRHVEARERQGQAGPQTSPS
jgi:acyl carrier protein